MSSVFLEYEDGQARRITVVAFLALTGFFLVAANVVSMPSRETIDRSLEVLMLESIATLEEAVTGEEEPKDVRNEELPPEEAISTGDLEELMSAFDAFSFSDVALEDGSLTEADRSETVSERNQVPLDMEVDDLFGDFGSSQDLSTELPGRGRVRSTRTLRPGLLSESGNVEQPDFRRVLETASPEEDGMLVRERETGDLLESIRDSLKTGSPTLDADPESAKALMAWMRQWESPLDPGIRALFARSSSDITVKTEMLAGGTTYGVQLLYAVESKTLHIALLDGDSLYYFIDPELQKKPNYFRKGTVRRDATTQVILVESEELPARSQEALRLFEVFISWWSKEKEAHG